MLLSMFVNQLDGTSCCRNGNPNTAANRQNNLMRPGARRQAAVEIVLNRSFGFREDSHSSMRWESEPFEIDGDFRPCDIYIGYWMVPDADGTICQFIACDRIKYRLQPLKINVVDPGYKAIPDKVWRTILQSNSCCSE